MTKQELFDYLFYTIGEYGYVDGYVSRYETDDFLIELTLGGEFYYHELYIENHTGFSVVNVKDLLDEDDIEYNWCWDSLKQAGIDNPLE